MKFTLSWLKEHLETNATLDQIVEAMVAVGLEVEHVDDPAERLAAFTIGEVLAAEQHPGADKLRVCRVATKDGEKQIVCGAPNARAGIKIAYAPVGAYVPGIDLTLSKAKIRGVESFGMMCSARELELGDDHDGIIEAPADAEVGASVAEALQANDPVIDFEVTPNRPDTNGVGGVACDLAAAGLGALQTPSPAAVAGAFACPQKIGLHFTDEAVNACPAFAGRVVRGVKNGPSPKWLQDRLRAIGLRPINALVDVTNYMSYDRARPLHVYDAQKLKGEIHARLGRAGESFLALDGKAYEIDETMCVIADESGVLGLGGVMGGETTGCTEETVDVFIESAYFDPLRTAKTGRKTGITSDARYRFERGVDPAFVVPGLDMATRLILDLCGGEASAIEIAGAVPEAEKIIAFPPTETKRLTGIEIDDAEARRILEALGFAVAPDGGRWSVGVPSWRPDVDGKADIVEEVARVVGFDRLPSAVLPARTAVEAPKLTPAQVRRGAVRRALAARGLLEAVTWSFMDRARAAAFTGDEAAQAGNGTVLANPISSDLGVMRPSILPNLVDAIQRNADRGTEDLALFEVAPVYASDRPEGQSIVAAGARALRPQRHWARAKPEDAALAGVMAVKADAIGALSAAGVKGDQLQTSRAVPTYFHPGRAGVLQQGPKNRLAAFGELHPGALAALGADGPLFGFEVYLDAIPNPRARSGKTRSALDASEFMPLTRDFAFIVDEGVEAGALLKAVRGAEKALLADAVLFDVYRGKGVDPGKKSLAVEVTLQPKDKTLTEAEIEAVAERIVTAVHKAVGGALRA